MIKVTITRISDDANKPAQVEFTGEGCSGFVSAPWDEINHLEPGGEYPISFGDRIPAETESKSPSEAGVNPNGQERSNPGTQPGQTASPDTTDLNAGLSPSGESGVEDTDPNAQGAEASGDVSETSGPASSGSSATGDPGDEQQ